MYQQGDRVYWTTGECFGTVTRVADYGDVWIMCDGAYVPVTTRPCFLRPARPGSDVCAATGGCCA